MRALRTYAVYSVINRRGEHEFRAYKTNRSGDSVGLPKKLKIRFCCMVDKCRYPIDAIRAWVNRK